MTSPYKEKTGSRLSLEKIHTHSGSEYECTPKGLRNSSLCWCDAWRRKVHRRVFFNIFRVIFVIALYSFKFWYIPKLFVRSGPAGYYWHFQLPLDDSLHCDFLRDFSNTLQRFFCFILSVCHFLWQFPVSRLLLFYLILLKLRFSRVQCYLPFGLLVLCICFGCRQCGASWCVEQQLNRLVASEIHHSKLAFIHCNASA